MVPLWVTFTPNNINLEKFSRYPVGIRWKSFKTTNAKSNKSYPPQGGKRMQKVAFGVAGLLRFCSQQSKRGICSESVILRFSYPERSRDSERVVKKSKDSEREW